MPSWVGLSRPPARRAGTRRSTAHLEPHAASVPCEVQAPVRVASRPPPCGFDIDLAAAGTGQASGEGALIPPQQPLQCLEPSVPAAMTKLSKGGGCESNLRHWWQSLLDEPLEPTQGRSLVMRRIGSGQQLAQQERIGQGESAHLSRGYLRSQEVATVSRLDALLGGLPPKTASGVGSGSSATPIAGRCDPSCRT
jgi:hypothetical protein